MFSLGTPAFSHSVLAVRLTDDSKLTIGVNVSVNSCMLHCVSPVADWRVFQVVTQTKIDG